MVIEKKIKASQDTKIDRKSLPIAKLVSEIIYSAVVDLDSNIFSASKGAWDYFKSKEFKKHCDLMDKDSDAFLSRHIYHKPSFIKIELLMNKQNLLINKEESVLNDSSSIFIKDYKKTREIIFGDYIDLKTKRTTKNFL